MGHPFGAAAVSTQSLTLANPLFLAPTSPGHHEMRDSVEGVSLEAALRAASATPGGPAAAAAAAAHGGGFATPPPSVSAAMRRSLTPSAAAAAGGASPAQHVASVRRNALFDDQVRSV